MLRIRLLSKEDCLEIAKNFAITELKMDPVIVSITDEIELLRYIPSEMFGQEYTVNKHVKKQGITYYYIGKLNWSVPDRFVQHVYTDCLMDIQ